MSEEKIRKYSNGRVTVGWKPEKCIHSTKCWKNLPEVFKPGQKPWINIDGAEDEKIVERVNGCPSGALFMVDAGDSPVETGKISSAFEPREFKPEANKKYLWCACGRSEEQPLCDATHKKTDIKPVLFTTESNESVWLCMCKQTGTPPYCDGTHRTLS